VTLLNDEFLGDLLHAVGDSYAVPPTGAADTLRRLHRDDDERAAPVPASFDLGERVDPPAGAVRRTMRSHRLLLVAASLIVLLALAGGAVLLGNNPSSTRSASADLHSVASPPAKSPGTPKSSAGTASPGFGISAPSKGAAPTPSSAHAAAGTTTNGTPATGATSLPAGAVGQSSKIQETGSLNLTVGRGRVATTIAQLTALAATYNGFVANSQSQSGDVGGTAASGTVTLQVPVADFSAVLKEAQSFGTVSQLQTKATDVTGQYVDLQARISALQDSLQQYLTIMTKATSIGDVLAVQAQVDTLQSEIEQLQGQLEVLTNETAYSTLTTTIEEAGVVHHRPPVHHESGLVVAWRKGVRGFVDGFEGLVRIAGPALFALLCLAAAVVGSRLLWRRLQRHNL
jgi:hypothetical protein